MPQDATIETQTEDPQVARAEIERTRARMSETIDEIEEVLLRKKGEIQDRLDVAAPIRERPIPSLGIALGAGVVLGFLTGESDDGDDREVHHRVMHERAETWELRARRLMRIAQEQEAALRRLGAVEGGVEDISWDPDPRFPGYDDEPGSEDPSRIDQVRDMISERVSTYLSDTIRQLFAQPR